ncbi:unnamed protein product [Echinostoma caproni]|uniref:Receptor protein serine/threonine kinase n=1 Tax=Echinostoma caproni TaxID=27848 RepID=A0A183AJT2_9TREM|nr:unnamed protein product [Echinostoma caproni]
MSPELLAKICTSTQLGVHPSPDFEETETDAILTPTVSAESNPSVMLSFDTLKASDVYAFGLVLWEVARRCRTQEGADPYLLPYGDHIPPEPTFYTMYETVCINGIRPTLSARWSEDPILLRFVRLLEECWCARPEERLTMLRIKKTLGELISREKESYSNPTDTVEETELQMNQRDDKSNQLLDNNFLTGTALTYLKALQLYFLTELVELSSENTTEVGHGKDAVGSYSRNHAPKIRRHP